MRRACWLAGGAAALALLTGGGWLAAGELAERRATALIERLRERLPVGSEVAYERLQAPALGTTRIDGLEVLVGPAGSMRQRIAAASIELEGEGPEGRIGTLRLRDLVDEEPAEGIGASLGAITAENVEPEALIAMLGGPRTRDTATGAVTAERIELRSGGDRVSAERAALARFDAGRLHGLTLDGVTLAASGSRDELRVARLRLGFLDVAQVDWSALGRGPEPDAAAQGAKAPGRERPAARLAEMETLLAAAEGLAREVEATGITATVDATPAVSLRVARLAAVELSRARLGPIEMSELVIDGEGVDLSLGHGRYDTVIAPFSLPELREAVARLPRTAEGVRELEERLAGIGGSYEGVVDRVVLDLPETGLRAGLGQARFDGTSGREGLRSRLAMDALVLDMRPDPGTPLAALGTITGSLRSEWSVDRAAGTASLDSMGLDLDGLAAVQASGRVALPGGGIGLGADPMALGLAHAKVVYTDRSLLSRLLLAWGEPSGLPPEMVVDAFAGIIADPGNTPWLDEPARAALVRFLHQPGRLELELAPAAPLAPGRLLGLAVASPEAFARAAGLRISASER